MKNIEQFAPKISIVDTLKYIVIGSLEEMPGHRLSLVNVYSSPAFGLGSPSVRIIENSEQINPGEIVIISSMSRGKINSIFGDDLSDKGIIRKIIEILIEFWSNEDVEESLRLSKKDVVGIIRGILYGEIPDLPLYSLVAKGGSRELYIAPSSKNNTQDGSIVILSGLSRENTMLFFSRDTSNSGCVTKIDEEINKHIERARREKIISTFREKAKKDFEIFLESMENSIIDLLDGEKKKP